jgi:DNA-binding response OmpR family regulator
VARVLIVDDDPDILNLVQFQLRHAGHRVATAGSATEAEAIVDERGRPDVAVLDVMMPGTDGFELLRILRAKDGLEGLPAIFLSARVLPEDIARGTELGAQYLTKPFVASALLAAINKAVTEGPDDSGAW